MLTRVIEFYSYQGLYVCLRIIVLKYSHRFVCVPGNVFVDQRITYNCYLFFCSSAYLSLWCYMYLFPAVPLDYLVVLWNKPEIYTQRTLAQRKLQIC